MKAWPFIALILATSCTIAGEASLSPQLLSKEIDAEGAKAVVDSLGDRFDDVLDHIDSGDTAWVLLTAKLAQGTDAGNSEGLAIALAYALPKNPTAVLAVVTEDDGILSTSRVCSMPFIEDTVKDRPAYKKAALDAIEAVEQPVMKKAKDSCLAVLFKSS